MAGRDHDVRPVGIDRVEVNEVVRLPAVGQYHAILEDVVAQPAAGLGDADVAGTVPLPHDAAGAGDLLDDPVEDGCVARPAVRGEIHVIPPLVAEDQEVPVGERSQLVPVADHVGRLDRRRARSVEPVHLERPRARAQQLVVPARPRDPVVRQQRRVHRLAARVLPPDRHPVVVEDRDVGRHRGGRLGRRQIPLGLWRARFANAPRREVGRQTADVVGDAALPAPGLDRRRLARDAVEWLIDALPGHGLTVEGERAAGPSRRLQVQPVGSATRDVVVDVRPERRGQRRGRRHRRDGSRALRGCSARVGGERGRAREHRDRQRASCEHAPEPMACHAPEGLLRRIHRFVTENWSARIEP